MHQISYKKCTVCVCTMPVNAKHELPDDIFSGISMNGEVPVLLPRSFFVFCSGFVFRARFARVLAALRSRFIRACANATK